MWSRAIPISATIVDPRVRVTQQISLSEQKSPRSVLLTFCRGVVGPAREASTHSMPPVVGCCASPPFAGEARRRWRWRRKSNSAGVGIEMSISTISPHLQAWCDAGGCAVCVCAQGVLAHGVERAKAKQKIFPPDVGISTSFRSLFDL